MTDQPAWSYWMRWRIKQRERDWALKSARPFFPGKRLFVEGQRFSPRFNRIWMNERNDWLFKLKVRLFLKENNVTWSFVTFKTLNCFLATDLNSFEEMSRRCSPSVTFFEIWGGWGFWTICGIFFLGFERRNILFTFLCPVFLIVILRRRNRYIEPKMSLRIIHCSFVDYLVFPSNFILFKNW